MACNSVVAVLLLASGCQGLSLQLHRTSALGRARTSSLKCSQDEDTRDYAPAAVPPEAKAENEVTRDAAPPAGRFRLPQELQSVSKTLVLPAVSLGDFVVQRAIQQQLYFIAELQKNAHLGTWLAQFEGHDHLESTGRKPGAPGLPGTYSAAFGQLRKTPYTAYLSTLGNAPVDVIQVEISRPQRRLSARELQNPFLAKQMAEAASTKEYADVPIVPKVLITRLLTTANVIADTWAFHLGELEASDTARVAADRSEQKAMPTAEMLRDMQLVEGGETAISWYTEDEPLPLHEMDHRACDRLVTLRALESLVAEVTALTPENAFECEYLGLEAVDDADEDGVDSRVAERRRKRKERKQASFAPIGDNKPAAARTAALSFLQEFAAYWVPKLTKGDERSVLEKYAVRPDPGMKERPRPTGAGADADAALEDLWAWMDSSPYQIPGGEFVTPARMGVRLRELRAAHAAEARRELLDEILPELTRSRITYTDYTEEDERLRLEQKKADAEAALVWVLDRSMEGLNEG